ncbi:MAG: hypothetical protein KBG28_19755 [Kofleriaceae bacterium]|nr:hypothetical protein [Kofleriaceae bacterium]MBP9206217.1 hypothetical protein [Kofleriaceae bacterium]
MLHLATPRSLLLAGLGLTAACVAADEPSEFDLGGSTQGKADGGSWVLVQLTPREVSLLRWQCDEGLFDPGGCDVTIEVDVAVPGAATADAAVAELRWRRTTPTTSEQVFYLHGGHNVIELPDQPRISTHTAMLSALDLPVLVEFELSWW